VLFLGVALIAVGLLMMAVALPRSLAVAVAMTGLTVFVLVVTAHTDPRLSRLLRELDFGTRAPAGFGVWVSAVGGTLAVVGGSSLAMPAPGRSSAPPA
jgi:hypothetical protein